jgi:hypothetical protein
MSTDDGKPLSHPSSPQGQHGGTRRRENEHLGPRQGDTHNSVYFYKHFFLHTGHVALSCMTHLLMQLL